MGRAPFVALVVAAVTACGPPPPSSGPEAHAALACADCHQGGAADRTLASVPTEACTASGCHDRGVATVALAAGVAFDHRVHEGEEGISVGCAGCHDHPTGDAPLGNGAGTCGLCHADQLTGDRPEACRACHASPSHEGVTSQGVAVPHEGLPWIEGGCLRCHFEVATPVQQVDPGRCAACHEDLGRAAAAGVGEDLHPAHAGSACTACHEEDAHRIEAMSSAVALDCAHCHTTAHEVGVDEPTGSPLCSACHRDTHADPQRLLLGIVPLGRAAAPSDHFMDGLTCRSCHADAPGADGARGASGAACATCHRREYGVIARWWTAGVRERVALVDRYLSAAEALAEARDLEAPRAAADRARGLVTLVQRGGGVHNLALSHRMLEQALTDAVEVYEASGRAAPATPSLGRAPRQGLCSYCHYRLEELRLTDEMDDAFHRDVLGGG